MAEMPITECHTMGTVSRLILKRAAVKNIDVADILGSEILANIGKGNIDPALMKFIGVMTCETV